MGGSPLTGPYYRARSYSRQPHVPHRYAADGAACVGDAQWNALGHLLTIATCSLLGAKPASLVRLSYSKLKEGGMDVCKDDTRASGRIWRRMEMRERRFGY